MLSGRPVSCGPSRVFPLRKLRNQRVRFESTMPKRRTKPRSATSVTPRRFNSSPALPCLCSPLPTRPAYHRARAPQALPNQGITEPGGNDGHQQDSRTKNPEAASAVPSQLAEVLLIGVDDRERQHAHRRNLGVAFRSSF